MRPWNRGGVPALRGDMKLVELRRGNSLRVANVSKVVPGVGNGAEPVYIGSEKWVEHRLFAVAGRQGNAVVLRGIEIPWRARVEFNW